MFHHNDVGNEFYLVSSNPIFWEPIINILFLVLLVLSTFFCEIKTEIVTLNTNGAHILS